MSIQANYQKIKSQIPENVTLVAVSKTKSVEEIMQVYNCGQRDFGENKVQEMCDKAEQLPKDIRWHMIGHVQSNKIKYMADFVYLIHGIDKKKSLKEVQKQAENSNRIQEVLLQVKIAEEDSKFGMTKEEVKEILEIQNQFNNVKIVGLMGMATFTDDESQLKKEFEYLNSIFKQLKIQNPEFKILSMGMSDDFPIAIEEGSNMVRVGSAIFGTRNY